ncbi:hypothetical protein NIES267_06220 [Calothrix parasitica NIES-267]|uniref:Uncharacterized protein n=1 Tax=Calothrix parasitica NIES-267 TaxID=1973488 RepID=A0A1Z4LIS8_9CYAN|nr:hypothetical protein NIES267_06220 [Calothrix parasitica NIES-267]
MRRDAIFYTIFQRSPELIFEFIESRVTSATNYRFESVEVKEPTFRIDGVFLPPQDTSPRVFLKSCSWGKPPRPTLFALC